MDPYVLAQVLIAVVKQPEAQAAESTTSIAENLLAEINKLPESQLKTALSTITRSTAASAEAIVQKVSDTTDRSLKVLVEEYKKYMSRIALGFGGRCGRQYRHGGIRLDSV